MDINNTLKRKRGNKERKINPIIIILIILAITMVIKQGGFIGSMTGIDPDCASTEPILFDSYVSQLEDWTGTICSTTDVTITNETTKSCLITIDGMITSYKYYSYSIGINPFTNISENMRTREYILVTLDLTCSQQLIAMSTEGETESTSFEKDGRTIYTVLDSPPYAFCNQYDNVLIGANPSFLNMYWGEYIDCCVDTTWTPSISTICSGTSFTQTSNCGNTRSATGTGCTGDGETSSSSKKWYESPIIWIMIIFAFILFGGRKS